MRLTHQNPTLRNRNFEQGFSFLESLVVMAIIVLMVWIVIPGWKMRDQDMSSKDKLGIFSPQKAPPAAPAEVQPEQKPTGSKGSGAPANPETPVDAEPASPPLSPELGSPVSPPAAPEGGAPVTPPSNPDAGSAVIPASPPVIPATGVVPEVPAVPAVETPSTVIPATPAVEAPEIPDTPPVFLPDPPAPNP